jgi:hypothetical protein
MAEPSILGRATFAKRAMAEPSILGRATFAKRAMAEPSKTHAPFGLRRSGSSLAALDDAHRHRLRAAA